jgi:iron complex outermembrane receptor protein
LAGSVEYDLGPATIYSVTSYWHGKLQSRGDIDGGFGCSFCGPGFTNNSFPGFIPFAAQSQDNVPSLDQFTEELRIASNNSTGLGYQAGIFYFDEDLDIESFDFGSPTDPTPDAIVKPTPGRQSPRHFRVAQLQVRQWPDAAGRRALES